MLQLRLVATRDELPDGQQKSNDGSYGTQAFAAVRCGILAVPEGGRCGQSRWQNRGRKRRGVPERGEGGGTQKERICGQVCPLSTSRVGSGGGRHLPRTSRPQAYRAARLPAKVADQLASAPRCITRPMPAGCHTRCLRCHLAAAANSRGRAAPAALRCAAQYSSTPPLLLAACSFWMRSRRCRRREAT